MKKPTLTLVPPRTVNLASPPPMSDRMARTLALFNNPPPGLWERAAKERDEQEMEFVNRVRGPQTPTK